MSQQTVSKLMLLKPPSHHAAVKVEVADLNMAQSTFFAELEKYDYVQFVTPDWNSIPKGKIVPGKFKEKIARKGFEISCGVSTLGPNGEQALLLSEVFGQGTSNGELKPCLDTLVPWPWVGHQGRRVGNVLCDLNRRGGTPEMTSPRQLMKAQLDALRNKHGLTFKSAFEYEFDLFKEGSLEMLGEALEFDVGAWGQNIDLFSDLIDHLALMGIDVSSLTQEMSKGQWELNTEPVEGIHGGDVGFYVKRAIKGFFKTRGYDATFMTKPTADAIATAFHLNHSLWTRDGVEERNVLLDEGDPDKLSATARHWMAGILAHAPALTALFCPTYNCYRGLNTYTVPGWNFWGVDDRDSLLRVRNAGDNVFVENRLPSGPCSPYIAIAATIAAGMDGLDRRLQCPPARDTDHAHRLPTTLAQALTALEEDSQLRDRLGDRFVQSYVIVKKYVDVALNENVRLKTEEEQLEFERMLYMKNL